MTMSELAYAHKPNEENKIDKPRTWKACISDLKAVSQLKVKSAKHVLHTQWMWLHSLRHSHVHRKSSGWTVVSVVH